jgi:hypothetical protein
VLRGFAGGVAGAGLSGADAQSQYGAAGENELFRVHLPSPWFSPFHEIAPSTHLEG